MTTAARRMRLGDSVMFYDHNRLPKAAIVTGTRQSIDSQRAQSEGQVPAIDSDDALHLSVFSPTGSVEARYNIHQGSNPGCWEPRDGTG